MLCYATLCYTTLYYTVLYYTVDLGGLDAGEAVDPDARHAPGVLKRWWKLSTPLWLSPLFPSPSLLYF